MPLFGKKQFVFTRVGDRMDIGKYPDEWTNVMYSASVVSGMVGGIKPLIEEFSGELMDVPEELELSLECAALTLEIVDRVAFQLGDADFRDALLKFLEPPILAVSIDSILSSVRAESKEFSKSYPVQMFNSAIDELAGIASSYVGTIRVVRTDTNYSTNYSQEGSLVGIFQERIGRKYSVADSPMWHVSSFSIVTKCLTESGYVDFLETAATAFKSSPDMKITEKRRLD